MSGPGAAMTLNTLSILASDMGRGLRDLTINLRNMLFMRKLKNVTIMNSTEALGIIPSDHGSDEGLDRIIALWGSDRAGEDPQCNAKKTQTRSQGPVGRRLTSYCPSTNPPQGSPRGEDSLGGLTHVAGCSGGGDLPQGEVGSRNSGEDGEKAKNSPVPNPLRNPTTQHTILQSLSNCSIVCISLFVFFYFRLNTYS
jgi:hypothetical protein